MLMCSGDDSEESDLDEMVADADELEPEYVQTVG